MLVGSGANGKSTFLKLLQRCLGKDNYSSEALQDFSDNKFRMASLAGKLANICPDLAERTLNDSITLKHWSRAMTSLLNANTSQRSS